VILPKMLKVAFPNHFTLSLVNVFGSEHTSSMHQKQAKTSTIEPPNM
jgi:hypothetical protein